MGEETFTIEAQSDADIDGNPMFREVASDTIQIWPRAQAKIAGLE